MEELVLKLDVAGRPLAWISAEAGAVLYCTGRVAWEAGERTLRLRGGVCARTGLRSVLDVSTIVAARGHDRQEARYAEVPALTNARLFRRDGHMCLYCGERLAPSGLTRDHVLPLSRGGPDVWENVATACRACNQRKADRLLGADERTGMHLLAVPYAPNRAEGLILGNRRILADQMAFLRERVRRHSRLF